MSVKCNVQERTVTMPGLVTKVNGQDDNWQIACFVLKDTDGSELNCTVDLPPEVHGLPLQAAGELKWDVQLAALSNPLGDTAICATHIWIGNKLLELYPRHT